MELFRSLAVMVEPPSDATPRLAELLGLPRSPEGWEYTQLFLEQLYPYACVYLGSEGMLGGEARDRVAGLWRAIGESPPAEPDHLAVLLALYARLAELEAAAVDETRQGAWGRVRTTLLWEHLLSWLPPWLEKLSDIASPPYVAWGALLGEALDAEAAGRELPEDLPLHLREAPELPAPGCGGDDLLAALLAPARSGVILTRSDLARAAADLGLGMRAGERRWALRALLSQQPKATLDWLAAEAETQARLHARRGDIIAGFWQQRAEATSARLRAAAADVTDEFELADP